MIAKRVVERVRIDVEVGGKVRQIERGRDGARVIGRKRFRPCGAQSTPTLAASLVNEAAALPPEGA